MLEVELPCQLIYTSVYCSLFLTPVLILYLLDENLLQDDLRTHIGLWDQGIRIKSQWTKAILGRATTQVREEKVVNRGQIHLSEPRNNVVLRS